MATSTATGSPSVTFREIDLTSVIPNVQSTTGVYVGEYKWGPADTAELISNEGELAETFGTPGSGTGEATDFMSASQFLRYSSNLFVTRVVGTGAENATASDSDDNTLIKNSVDYDGGTFVGDSAGGTDFATGAFFAKYPGEIGNSLRVSVFPAGTGLTDSDSQVDFNGWAYEDEFDTRPTTSTWASEQGFTDDELHIAVIDADGLFSGTPGTVLERWPYLSVATDAKRIDGGNNYYRDVINDGSNYIWVGDWSAGDNSGTNWDRSSATMRTTSQTDFGLDVTDATIYNKKFTGGANGSAVSTGQVTAGYDIYSDVETYEVDFLIARESGVSNQTTIMNHLISLAGSTRKDCVAVGSPSTDDVVAKTDAVTRAKNFANSLSGGNALSYAVVDNMALKVYDKYNDQFIWIPAASSTAGIMAATDLNRGAWFSPAGQRRGGYLGVSSIAYNASKAERDTLYRVGVNPVVNLPQQGVVLFGDKTQQPGQSAFNRINVRRLFLVIERAIARAARDILFEFNDEFTRAEFVGIVDPFLRAIKGQRGITDYAIQCDEGNNPASVVDNNQFVASIFVKPARSINYITLNFVAVRTGVDFEEVIGTV